MRKKHADRRQADIASKKKELAKQTMQVKARQKEAQTSELEIRKLTLFQYEPER